MPRFFLPEYDSNELKIGNEIRIKGDDAHHLVSVLRARVGEKVTVCNAEQIEAECEFAGSERNEDSLEAVLSVISVSENKTEAGYEINVFQGMPKGKKTDTIVQKCVELGATKVTFVYSDRSVPEYENEKEEAKKIARLNKIAFEASKQCGRGKLTEIKFEKSLDEAILQMKKSDVSFFLFESEKDNSIKNELKKEFASVSFFVGPEGGISEREAELLNYNGIEAFTLGKRILRTETAPIAVLSMILYEKEL